MFICFSFRNLNLDLTHQDLFFFDTAIGRGSTIQAGIDELPSPRDEVRPVMPLGSAMVTTGVRLSPRD